MQDIDRNQLLKVQAEMIEKLEEEVQELKEELDMCIDIIEESGVDYDEVVQAYS